MLKCALGVAKPFCFEILYMYVPACEKCLFYIPGRTGQCRKYLAYRGRGKMVYDFTENVRADPKKCGPHGRLFIKKVFTENKDAVYDEKWSGHEIISSECNAS